MSDQLDEALRNIQADKLEARTEISEEEKQQLVERWGPKRVRDIVKAKGQIPASRIPFVFNNVDTQDLLDILANDMTAAIAKALKDSQGST